MNQNATQASQTHDSRNRSNKMIHVCVSSDMTQPKAVLCYTLGR